MFTRAIVRPPSPNFAAGLTTVDLGQPDYLLALEQHEAYCSALKRCGLELIRLEPDKRFPDGTFVEDTAVLTEHGAVITAPGAASRSGETDAISEVLKGFYSKLDLISEPATLDGGDVCEAGTHFFIGISERTNESGAAELAKILSGFGYRTTTVDIRGVPNILHLKSGIASIGQGRMLVIESLFDREEFRECEKIRVPTGEEYAANCIQVNDFVLVPAGFPRTAQAIKALGHEPIALEMCEFQKMDGGLSCLSLRF